MYKFTIPPVNGTNTTQSLINIVKEERVKKKDDIISFLNQCMRGDEWISEVDSLKIFKLYIHIYSVFQGC